MAFVSINKASVHYGLHPNTLRKLADNNLIDAKRFGKHRRFFIDDGPSKQREMQQICYCRVSSVKQHDDLARQIQEMQRRFPKSEIVSDIASGLNFKRKGLRSILERLMQGAKLQVVVAHRDRLSRFSVELFQYLLALNGGELLVLNQSSGSPEAELTEDLLSILHHFSCRMHGKRSHQGRKETEVGKDL